MPHVERAAPAELQSVAVSLARAAGMLALAGRRSLPAGQPLPHDTKSSATDPVTEFDRSAEALIVNSLRAQRPDDAIIGEEGTNDDGTTGIAWHIDPIDGTANFLYDLPAWCTSVAAVDSDGAIAGAVFLPVTDEMFTAVRGGGATLNGDVIRTGIVNELHLALVGTGFSYLQDRRVVQARRIRKILPQVRDIRRFGSAAIDLCFVACGRLDAYFEEHLNSWDFAAGGLIASEAGAITSNFADGPADEQAVVAAVPGIHAQLLATIQENSD